MPPFRLVGRDQELATLAALARSAAEGHGTMVLIEGEPGIGKSALVRAAVEAATQAGTPDPALRVFTGAGDELGQELPFQPLLDALRVREEPASHRRSVITSLLHGDLSLGPGADASSVLAEQLLALIIEECSARPALLVVDDLQWADRATILLLNRLARALETSRLPLLLIAIMRPVPARDDVQTLWRAQGDRIRLRLGPLAPAAAADLITSLVGGIPDGALLDLAKGAAGNPFYITELVAALTRGTTMNVSDEGVVTATGGAVPGSLTAAIADRLSFVSLPAGEALRAAALLGVDFAIPDLATIMRRSVADLVSVIHEATLAGVLDESGTRLRFRHPLIRAALYEAMPLPVRTERHAQAAQALAEARSPADRVARQLLRATSPSGGPLEPMREWMMTWVGGAADQLVAQAPQVAVDLLRWAVASAPAAVLPHARLASRLADALYRTGDRQAAEQVASAALTDDASLDVLVDLHWILAQCRMLAGRSAESLATLDQALATPGLTHRQRARLLVLTARTYSMSGEMEAANQAATEALAEGDDAADAWARAWALSTLAFSATAQGQLTRALSLYDQAVAATQGNLSLADLRLLVQINKAATLGNLGRYPEALALAEQVLLLADEVGTTFRLAQARSLLAQLLFEVGRWDEALAEIANLPADLKEPAAACVDLGMAAVICFLRGDAEAARRHLAAAEPHASLIGRRLVPPLALARSLEREIEGAVPDALAELSAWLDGSTEEVGQAEDLLADATRLAVRSGNLDLARHLAKYAADFGSASPAREANALYCTGLVRSDPALLRAAAERYAAAYRALPRARALEAAAEAYASAGDATRARAALDEAARAYSGLGIAPGPPRHAVSVRT